MRLLNKSCGARVSVLVALALGAAGSAYGQGAPLPTISTTEQSGLTTATVAIDASGIAIGGPTGSPEALPGRVIVRFRSGVSFLPGSGRNVPLVPAANVHLVDNPGGLTVQQVLNRYRANPNVIYAEPDFLVRAVATPTDPDFAAKQWDMMKIAAPTAWDLHTDSSGIVVAIIDTGIDFGHPDLQANLYADPSNASIHGYTCMNGSCVPGGQDDHGHGTHVAGTIGAVANNGIGIAGLNWRARLLAVKFLNSSGSGSLSDAVLAFNLLTNLKKTGVDIRVTNNSWGGGGYSQALKDAMLGLEDTPGYPATLNVCAAGNSGVNADFSPMYPGAYDNRGILSVLATDSTDAGASFSNYGLMNVDLAAPGASTYSTVPTGSCSLCDPSGYKYLSGTSMASPHVAGVAVALMSRLPWLSAAQARDQLLHPGSYDAMAAGTRAQQTSSGGRLNFFKAITNNGFLSNPVLNEFPSVSLGPNAYVYSGGQVSFYGTTATDPDNDPLRLVTGRGPVGAGSTWLFGYELSVLFPNLTPFTAPVVARTAAMAYDTSAADNRGGGVAGRNWAVVAADTSAGQPPTLTLTVPTTGTVNVAVPVGVVVSDPEGRPTAWELWASGSGGSSGVCCYTGNSSSISFSAAGVYRISVQAIDRELNVSAQQSAVVAIDGATGVPPIAVAALDRDSGPAPLTVNVSMAGSSDPDGSIAYYYIGCGNGYTVGTTSPAGNCTFTTPGSYWLLLQVRDNAGNMGLTSKYVVATPPDAPSALDSTPPTLSFVAPTPGATVSGSVSLAVSAADTGGSGLKEVEYYLDSGTSSLGKSTVSPFTLAWNASTAASGDHTVYAVARDNAGNLSTMASVTVSVLAPPQQPTNLTATATSPTTTTVAWSDVSSDESGFKVERKTQNSSFALVATLAANATSYADTGVTQSTSYTYRVAAFNNAGSSLGTEATVTTPMAPPIAPTSLVATAASASSVALSWTDAAVNESGYRVERRIGTSFTAIASLGAGATTYTDTALTPNQTYTYRIVAYNAAGEAVSNEAAATTPAAAPSAPASFTAQAVSKTQINLNWTDVANESGFTLERSTNQRTWTALASLVMDSTRYNDSGLKSRTTYYYRIRAYNAGGNSPYATATATTP